MQDDLTGGAGGSIDGAPERRDPESSPTEVLDLQVGDAPDPTAAGASPGDDRPSDASRGRALDLPNEAIPAVAPEIGTDPVGSIPAARARAVWSRAHAFNWRLYLVRFVSAGLAVVITVAVLPGLAFVGWHWGTFLRIAIIFGVLNATVKPLLQILILRFIFSTYGIVVVGINTLLLLLLGALLTDTFQAYRPISLVAGGVVVGILGLMLETLLGATPPVLDRDYKERNGLR